MAKKNYLNWYNVQAVKAEIVPPDKEGKSPAVFVTMRVVDGPFVGKEITEFLSLHENAKQYSAEALQTLGWTGKGKFSDFDGLGRIKARAGEYLDTYNGKTRTKYSVFPLKSLEVATGDELKKFDAMFADLGGFQPIEETESNRAGELPEAREYTAPAQQESQADDEIPF